jgi:hypothetical protein
LSDHELIDTLRSRARRGVVPDGGLAAALTVALLAAGAYVVPIYLFYVDPVRYVRATTEDYTAEAATAVAWLVAFAMLAIALARHRALRRPLVFAFAAGALLMGLEEISWGQRLLHIEPPAYFKARNIQGELNLHNLIRSIDYELLGVGIAVWALAFPIVTLTFPRLDARVRQLGFPVVPLYLMPAFLVAVLYILTLGLPIATDAASIPLFLDEWGELYFGCGALLLALHLAVNPDASSAHARAPRAASICAVLALVAALTPTGIGGRPWTGMLRYRLTYFAGTSYPAYGQYVQAAMLCDFMEAHPEFLESGDNRWLGTSTRVLHGDLLMRMGRTAEAHEVLARALTEQERRAAARPDDPVPDRNRARIQELLGDETQARAAFARAVRKDRARIATATDAETRAWAHWSLAKTLLAKGAPARAKRQAQAARETTNDGNLGKVIENWIYESLS